MAELLVAMGFITLVILTVLGLTTTLFRTGQESLDTTTAAAIADAQIQRVIDAGQKDSNFWITDYLSTPYDSGTIKANRTDYEWEVTAATVIDQGTGGELGTSTGNADNRLKKVDIVVRWWNSDTDTHQGYGKLEVRASRLVSQVK